MSETVAQDIRRVRVPIFYRAIPKKIRGSRLQMSSKPANYLFLNMMLAHITLSLSLA